MIYREKDKQRILNMIIDTDNCIEYPILNPDGYGLIQFTLNRKKKRVLTHRLSFELFHNITLRSEDIICHKCDNPACINPKHLFCGTHKINVEDKCRKGRQAKGINNGRYKNGHYSKYNYVAKPETPFENLCGRSLTKDVVIEIKTRIKNKSPETSLMDISKYMNIPYQTIRDINCGRTYKSIQI